MDFRFLHGIVSFFLHYTRKEQKEKNPLFHKDSMS